MKNVLKRLFAVAIVAVSAFALISCGEQEAVVDAQHTIVFYSSQGTALTPYTDLAIAKFEEKYPGWKVSHVTQGGYDDVKEKVISDFQGKQQPDLAYCYSDHVAQYIQTSKVIDMNQFINSTETVKGQFKIQTGTDPDTDAPIYQKDSDGKYVYEEKDVVIGYSAEEISDFVESYWNEGYASNYGDAAKYGYRSDAMLTLPFVKSTELLYYNKTVLDELELSVPTTWAELWGQCDTIREAYPTATPLGYDSEANWFITMCQQNGWGYTSASGNHFLFNDEDQIAWLEELNEYYEKGYLTTQQAYGGYTSALFTKAASDGGAIYCVGSSGGASHQSTDAFEWGIAPIPGTMIGEELHKDVISQGPSLVMFYSDTATDKDEKAKMTFLFVKELLDVEFQATFAIASGYNPCRISSYDTSIMVDELAKTTSITAVAIKVGKSMVNDYFTSPAFVGSSTARTQVGNALYYALTGDKSAAKALKDAYENCGGK